MRRITSFCLLLVCLCLVGCAATQPIVPMSQQFYAQPASTVGIVFVEQKQAELFTWGDTSLLDMAIIATATAQLQAHIKTLDMSDFSDIKGQVAKILESKGFSVSMLGELPPLEKFADFSDPDKNDTEYYNKKDLRSLRERLSIDFLLRIQTFRVGVARTYNGFIPTSPPSASFGAEGQLTDLRNNRLLWHQGFINTKPADGDWDEPPNYPGLTNSYFIVLEETRKELLDGLLAKPTSTEQQKVAVKQ